MADEREAILRAAAAAMPHSNPDIWQDWVEGFTVHMEADDIVAIWQAARAERAEAAQPTNPEPIAHMWQHGETGMVGFVQHDTPEELASWERMNRPRKIIAPLYRHPHAAEAAQRVPLTEADILGIAANPLTAPCSPWWLKDDVLAGDVQQAAIVFAHAIERKVLGITATEPQEPQP